MNKQTLDAFWDQFRQKYGVYLRLLEEFPEERYHTHLVPEMRTFAELVVHVSGTVVRDIAEGVAQGAITADESLEARTAAGLRDRAALLGFAPPFAWGYADNAPEFQPAGSRTSPRAPHCRVPGPHE